MAANLEEVMVTARTFSNVLALPVSGKIGDIEIHTTIEETYTDTLQVTEHPIQSGAAITDHSYKKPAELVLRCGWSNSSLKALVAALGALSGVVRGVLSGATMAEFSPGWQTSSDYVGGIYSKLLSLQEAREPITITASLRQYNNMLITGLQVNRDQKTSQVLMVTATCREALIVNTASATLPAKEDQANPADTAEVESAGAKQVSPVSPGPGGSVPPNEW